MHLELTKLLVIEQLEEARTAGLFGPSVVLEELGYPAFYIRFLTRLGHERLLRFDYADYDTFPMDVEPVDLVSRIVLPTASWMLRDDGAVFPMHSDSHTPFLCIEGTRRFYTHHGHDPLTTGRPWEMHRDAMRFVGLLQCISDRFRLGRWT